MVETAYKNGRISNFEGLMTLTLDRVILHTVVHHSWTSIYMPNFIAIEGGHRPPTTLGIKKIESLGCHVALFA